MVLADGPVALDAEQRGGLGRSCDLGRGGVPGHLDARARPRAGRARIREATAHRAHRVRRTDLVGAARADEPWAKPRRGDGLGCNI